MKSGAQSDSNVIQMHVEHIAYIAYMLHSILIQHVRSD